MELIKHKQINEAILEAKHILILPDERVDGDSLGAALAFYRYLDRSYKKVTIVCAEEVPQKYHYLNHVELCETDLSLLNDDSIDLVISVDCSDAEFIKGMISRIPNKVMHINIDHHATNSEFGDLYQVVCGAASTTEIVFNFFVTNRIWIDPEMATSLLAGVYYDTTVLSNRATTNSAVDVASELILLGARVKDVIEHQHFNRSLVLLKAWGIALERLRVHPPSGAVTTWITAKDIERLGVDFESMDGLTNFLHGVIDANTVIVLREQGGSIKASLRTMNGNVGKLAKMLGGGGHIKASGFSVSKCKFVEKNGVWSVA